MVIIIGLTQWWVLLTPATPLEVGASILSGSDMPYSTHKITLDLTFKQKRWFSQQCGYARFAYNQALSDFKMGLKADNL
ncbi:helix-turn-helix domain-containing protein [Candidatus Poribacteria bacterium]|nr:helix-turn-helix domain-containing protein [Candidatus Poribacteria bacterium]